MEIFLISVGLIAIAFSGIAIKLIFKKNGEKLNDREEITIEKIIDSLVIKPNLRKKKASHKGRGIIKNNN